MLKQSKLNLAAVAALVLATSGLRAAEPVDETRAAAADGRIDFRAVTGEFRVFGHDGNELRLTGTLGEDVEELVIEGDADHWRIRLETKKNRGWDWNGDDGSKLTLYVPHAARLDFSAVSADVEVRDLTGAEVSVKTVSGDLELANVRPGELRAESVSGDVRADSGGREVNRLKSVSGNVSVHSAAGRIELESVSGDVEVEGDSVSELRVQSVSGDADVRIRPTANARIRLESHSGDVELLLPADTGLAIDAETFSGDIRSAFGGTVQSGRGPGERLSFETGSGDVRVEANSFSGSVTIGKLD